MTQTERERAYRDWYLAYAEEVRNRVRVRVEKALSEEIENEGEE